MLTTVKRQHTLGFAGAREKNCDFFAAGFISVQGGKK